MLKNLFFYSVFSLFITMAGCTAGSEGTDFNFGTGNYKFVMSDSTGNKIAEGTLNVTQSADGQVSGTYEFTKIHEADFPGLSSMSGEFAGNINRKEKIVFINTNPKIADSNVFWNMKIRSSSLYGDWMYSQFRGVGNKGKIKITK